MKRLLSIVLLVFSFSAFFTVKVGAVGNEAEYVISGEGEEYKLEAYSMGAGTVIKKSNSLIE